MYNIFLTKKEKELIGREVILKKPKKENWKEWAELRQRSRNFLQPWEPKWPSHFLTKNSFDNLINMVDDSLKKKTGYNFFIFKKEIYFFSPIWKFWKCLFRLYCKKDRTTNR